MVVLPNYYNCSSKQTKKSHNRNCAQILKWINRMKLPHTVILPANHKSWGEILHLSASHRTGFSKSAQAKNHLVRDDTCELWHNYQHLDFNKRKLTLYVHILITETIKIFTKSEIIHWWLVAWRPGGRRPGANALLSPRRRLLVLGLRRHIPAPGDHCSYRLPGPSSHFLGPCRLILTPATAASSARATVVF